MKTVIDLSVNVLYNFCGDKMNLRFYTLGCKVNQYESEQIRSLLQNSHLAQQDIDIVIVNSCTVTAESSRKTRQALNRFRKEYPDAVLVLTGCLPQAFPQEAEKTPADLVLGNRNNLQIVSLIDAFLTSKQQHICVQAHGNGEAFAEHPIEAFEGHTRAFVKIQDGCNRFCSYCIIPYARGRSRSRQLQDIREELVKLAANGYREIVLTGIDLSVYGADIGCDLADAVELAQQIEGIDRIRLGSLEPDRMTVHLLDRFAACDKFCPQFHLSLQSGSDPVLKRMNRHYTADEYRALCTRIRSLFADAAITTDIITGFPGETQEDHLQTIRFAEEIGFEKVHVFPYSERSGTRAAAFSGQVEKKVRSERARELAAVCDGIRKRYLCSNVGKSVAVLFETPVNGEQHGYTASYLPIRVKTEKALTGELHTVKIIAARDDFCEGILE